MFTVKTIIEKVVLLREMDEPIFALEGSTQWDQVMERLMDCYNDEREWNMRPDAPVGTMLLPEVKHYSECPAYDFMELHPAFYEDPAGLTEIYPENVLEGKRVGHMLGDCIAIMILSCDDPERFHGEEQDNEQLKGIFYQLMYPGDVAYVMNSTGATIHTIK